MQRAGLRRQVGGQALETTLATVKWRIYKAREAVAGELLREGYGTATQGSRARSAVTS